MPYLTSWDVNTYLCLLSWGLPEDVVNRMIKSVKKINEEDVYKCALEYHSDLRADNWYDQLYAVNIEFKDKWRWSCPEKRRKFIVQWARSSWDWNCKHVWEKEPYVDKGEGTSRAGYWNSGESWSYYLSDCTIDTSDWGDQEEEQYFKMREEQRRLYVSEWYNGIHEGRYFLFFKENDLLSTWDEFRDGQNRYVGCISDMGERWQVAQDLLTIDGPGIGEKSREKIEHIDDMFVNM